MLHGTLSSSCPGLTLLHFPCPCIWSAESAKLCVCVCVRVTFRLSESWEASLLLYPPTLLLTSLHPIASPSLLNLVQCYLCPCLVNLVHWLSLVPRAHAWSLIHNCKVLSRPLTFQTFSSFSCVPRGIIISNVQFLFFCITPWWDEMTSRKRSPHTWETSSEKP